MNNTNKQLTEKNENKLEKKFSTGTISAVIWSNKTLNNEGEIIEFKTISLSKRYMDKTDNTWKNSSSLNSQDLPKAVLCLQKAYEYLTLKDDSVEKEYYPVEE
jgi:hypothetical protein